MISVFKIEKQHAVCRGHGEIFRKGWPGCYPAFAATGLTGWSSLPSTHMEIIKEARNLGLEVSEAPYDTVQIEADVMATTIDSLLKKKPLCCRLLALSPIAVHLLSVFKVIASRTELWPVSKCQICGEIEYGNRYRKLPPTEDANRSTSSWQHVCIGCVVLLDGPLEIWRPSNYPF